MDKLIKQDKSIFERSQEGRQKLIAKGFIQLPLGSYYRWIHKKFFDQLVEKKVLIKNRLGQFVPDKIMLQDLKRFDEQYKKWIWEQEKKKQLEASFK